MEHGTVRESLVWLVLDQLGQGVAGFDVDGRLRYSNAWLRSRLQSGRRGAELESEMTRFSSSLLEAAAAAEPRMRPVMTEAGRSDLWQDGFRHRLRGLWISAERRHDEIALVVLVEREPEDPPSEGSLRERFGLSRQEVRIARLLAEGSTNAEIAAALHISPHTARNHTRRILAKLGVRSRSQVGPRVLGRVPESPMTATLRAPESHLSHRALRKMTSSDHVAAA